MDTAFRVFVGWDSREDIAYQVCRHSLQRNASIPVEITPLRQPALREQGLYWRPEDPLASTEFTYTRFLVPALCRYQGWALFCDCDFLWLGDIAELVAQIDDRYAVMCVHHDHRPPEATKMDGKKQTVYPRKNWSSLVLYNCGHPANQALTPEVANTESGAFLHRFQWLDDDLIGAVEETWNWLEGWCAKPADGPPKVVHYTRGGPWFAEWQDVDYADLWLAEQAACLAEQREMKASG
ncbi:MAG: glycosyltransferase [Alphaproteobacteria bacterium]|nr:glycosyltransferase [Alphaproteobacteria bacterium]